MKILIPVFFTVFIFIPFNFAGSAEKTLCTLEWKTPQPGRIEFIFSPLGCEFPESRKRDCAYFRFTDLIKKEVIEGASPLLDQVAPSCTEKLELFGSTQASHPKAKIICPSLKQIMVQLSSPDNQQTILCPYPEQLFIGNK